MTHAYIVFKLKSTASDVEFIFRLQENKSETNGKTTDTTASSEEPTKELTESEKLIESEKTGA